MLLVQIFAIFCFIQDTYLCFLFNDHESIISYHCNLFLLAFFIYEYLINLSDIDSAFSTFKYILEPINLIDLATIFFLM
jgi:hypothetical protein